MRTPQEKGQPSQDLLLSTAKLALSTARQVRQLTSAVMRTLSVPLTSPVGTKLQEKAGRDQPWREDQILYTWGLVVLLICALPDTGLPMESLMPLRAHASACNSMDAIRPYVLECDVRTTFNGDAINVRFATTEELRDIAAALTRLLVALGAKVLYGAAPRGPLERAVAASLAVRLPHSALDAGT